MTSLAEWPLTAFVVENVSVGCTSGREVSNQPEMVSLMEPNCSFTLSRMLGTMPYTNPASSMITPTTRPTPPSSTPRILLGKDLRVLRADGRAPAARFFGPRRGRIFFHHLALTTSASATEVPQRLQNLRVGGLPSPHSGQMRSPGSRRRVGGRRWIDGAAGRACCGNCAAGWSVDPVVAACRAGAVADGRSSGRAGVWGADAVAPGETSADASGRRSAAGGVAGGRLGGGRLGGGRLGGAAGAPAGGWAERPAQLPEKPARQPEAVAADQGDARRVAVAAHREAAAERRETAGDRADVLREAAAERPRRIRRRSASRTRLDRGRHSGLALHGWRPS